MAIEQTTAGGPDTEISALRMVIGGKTVDAADGQTFEVVNPATGASIATAPLGGKTDVDRAVDAAQKAFADPKGWAAWPAGKRGRTLAKLAELVKKNSEELAQLESRNTGKPITVARNDLQALVRYFEFYGGAADKIHGHTIPFLAGYDVKLVREIQATEPNWIAPKGGTVRMIAQGSFDNFNMVVAGIKGSIASGLTLIFGIMDVVNFAHGALYALGAYLGVVVVAATQQFWLALILAPLGVGILGAVLP